MKKFNELISHIADIYSKKHSDAEKYLNKARKLKYIFGNGSAIIYSWFYSIPQKWIIVEPKILELMAHTNYFDLNKLLSIPEKRLMKKLKSLVFNKTISVQLINFCKAVRYEYDSWDNFSEDLKIKDIFNIFKKLRKYNNIRVTFKNLAAMKVFVGNANNLIILDTHISETLGIKKTDIRKYRTNEQYFKNLLKYCENITSALVNRSLKNVTMIKWGLSIWFEKAKISAEHLLPLVEN